MKKIILSCVLLFVLIVSCENESTLPSEKQIQFEFAGNSTATSSGGRMAANGSPRIVLVTIKGPDGNLLAEKKELALYQFGDRFLSAPLTLTAGGDHYSLTEFFVTDEDQSVLFATPKSGSAFAHLVTHPLVIEFSIEKDKITTVTPEVIALDDHSDAADFGYGQFGFQTVKTLTATFSSFVKGITNFELTASHLTIQGVNDTTSADTPVLWTYETDLEAKANTLVLKEANYYRVVATKNGYTNWKRNLKLSKDSRVEILFDAATGTEDVYIAGGEYVNNLSLAMYWKNGQPVRLSAVNSYANHIYVSGNDVYVTGAENGTRNAFYWKNGQKVIIPFNNSVDDFAYQIAVSGSDVHVVGTSFPNYFKPAYWKNGVRVPLNVSGKFTRADASGIAVDGADVYILGTEGNLGSTNDLPSYPRIWKNGVLTPLALPSSAYTRTFVNSIIVKNGHVYVCGFTEDPITSAMKVIFWKDNVPALLESPYLSSRLSALAHVMQVDDDGTVHIVGAGAGSDRIMHPVYWRNGVVINNAPQQDYPESYYGVISSGSGVVICGTSNNQASYWREGNKVVLDNIKSSATSIFFHTN